MYDECKAIGHAMDHVPSDWTPRWGIPLTVRCMRCSAERRDIIDAQGNLSSRRYIYPDGYKEWRGDHVGMKKPQYRLWLLEQEMAALTRRNKRRAAS